MSECQCVYCGDCNGSGQITVPTIGYPEWDLESCSNCHGTGIVEECRYCQDREEWQEANADMGRL